MAEDTRQENDEYRKTFDEKRERFKARRAERERIKAEAKEEAPKSRTTRTRKTADSGESGTLRVGERKERAESFEASASQNRIGAEVAEERQQEADNMAQMAIMALNNFAILYAKTPEAAMNELETLFIQGPLSQWLAVPSVYNKVAKNLTPVMCLMGLSIWGMRVNSLHAAVKKQERIERENMNRLQQTPTTEFEPERPGQVNPDVFNGTNDPSVQESFFQNNDTGEPEVVPSVRNFTGSLYSS